MSISSAFPATTSLLTRIACRVGGALTGSPNRGPGDFYSLEGSDERFTDLAHIAHSIQKTRQDTGVSPVPGGGLTVTHQRPLSSDQNVKLVGVSLALSLAALGCSVLAHFVPGMAPMLIPGLALSIGSLGTMVKSSLPTVDTTRIFQSNSELLATDQPSLYPGDVYTRAGSGRLDFKFFRASA